MIFALLLAFLFFRAVLLVVQAFLAGVRAATSLERHHVITFIGLFQYLLLQKGCLTRIILQMLRLS